MSTTFQHHLDEQYGQRGTAARERYEEEFEAFKVDIVSEELRNEAGFALKQPSESGVPAKATLTTCAERGHAATERRRQKHRTSPIE